MTKKYKIESDAGCEMGIFEGDTPKEALDEMARNAGYKDQADAEEGGVSPFEGTVEEIL